MSYVFECWRCGYVTRRPMCEYHAPVDGRPMNGDRWQCPRCREEYKLRSRASRGTAASAAEAARAAALAAPPAADAEQSLSATDAEQSAADAALAVAAAVVDAAPIGAPSEPETTEPANPKPLTATAKKRIVSAWLMPTLAAALPSFEHDEISADDAAVFLASFCTYLHGSRECWPTGWPARTTLSTDKR